MFAAEHGAHLEPSANKAAARLESTNRLVIIRNRDETGRQLPNAMREAYLPPSRCMHSIVVSSPHS